MLMTDFLLGLDFDLDNPMVPFQSDIYSSHHDHRDFLRFFAIFGDFLRFFYDFLRFFAIFCEKTAKNRKKS